MAADHFCLIWNNFQNSILSALGNLQSSQDLVDVTLMCEGRNVRAHKVILSACSPYFRNLFKETPCQHPVIILKDVSHYDLTALLQFMYQGEVMVTQDCLASFLKTAELLQISGLAGTAAAASALDPTEPLPKAPPDLVGPSPDSPGTAINKINSDLSLTKQKGRDKADKDSENKLPSFSEQTDPQQSCSYQTPTVAIKTESLDRDYDDMDTEPAEHRDNDEHFDNTSGHSEEPSILERSLKAQSGPHSTKYMDLSVTSQTVTNIDQVKNQTTQIITADKRKLNLDLGPVTKKLVKNIVFQKVACEKVDEGNETASHGWNMSQDGLCPHCNKMYSNQSALKYHVRLVHSDMLHMFCCHLCPESFKFREHYKIHMWEVHSVRS